MKTLISRLSSPAPGAALAAATALLELHQSRVYSEATLRGDMVRHGFAQHLLAALKRDSCDDLLRCLLLMLAYETAGDAMELQHLRKEGVIDCTVGLLVGPTLGAAALRCLLIFLDRAARGGPAIQERMVALDIIPALLNHMGGIFQKAYRASAGVEHDIFQNKAVVAFLASHLPKGLEDAQVGKRLALQILDTLSTSPSGVEVLLQCNEPTDHKLCRRFSKSLLKPWGAKYAARILHRMAASDPDIVAEILEQDGGTNIVQCIKSAVEALSANGTYCVGWAGGTVRVVVGRAGYGDNEELWHGLFGAAGSVAIVEVRRWIDVNFKAGGLKMKRAEVGWDLVLDKADVAGVHAMHAAEAQEVLCAVVMLAAEVIRGPEELMEEVASVGLHLRVLEVLVMMCRECKYLAREDVAVVAIMRDGGELALACMEACAALVESDVAKMRASTAAVLNELVAMMRGAAVPVAAAAAALVDFMVSNEVVGKNEYWDLLGRGMLPVLVSCMCGGSGPASGPHVGTTATKLSSDAAIRAVAAPYGGSAQELDGTARVQLVAVQLLWRMVDLDEVFMEAAAEVGVMEILLPLLRSRTAALATKQCALQLLAALMARPDLPYALAAVPVAAKKVKTGGLFKRLLSRKSTTSQASAEEPSTPSSYDGSVAGEAPRADRNLVDEAIKLLACAQDPAAGPGTAQVLSHAQRSACQLVALWASKHDASKLVLYEKGVFKHLKRLSALPDTTDAARKALKSLGVM